MGSFDLQVIDRLVGLDALERYDFNRLGLGARVDDVANGQRVRPPPLAVWVPRWLHGLYRLTDSGQHGLTLLHDLIVGEPEFRQP